MRDQTETRWKSWYLSLDGDFEDWVVRSEYRSLQLPLDIPPVFVTGEATVEYYYWQLGWKPGDRFSVYVQAEYTDVEQRHPNVVGGRTTYSNLRDNGVVFRWAFRPNLVAKAEYHETRYAALLVNPSITPGGVLFDISNERFDGDYSIVSLSYSF